jgi:hypothetical protein
MQKNLEPGTGDTVLFVDMLAPFVIYKGKVAHASVELSVEK